MVFFAFRFVLHPQAECLRSCFFRTIIISSLESVMVGADKLTYRHIIIILRSIQAHKQDPSWLVPGDAPFTWKGYHEVLADDGRIHFASRFSHCQLAESSVGN
ncbi:MAG: hypothetical protein JWM56_1109 [Candidatus Peribacteria bacterium]|nr:hypothetical protein [Candidatus Peribacteria bacterium]